MDLNGLVVIGNASVDWKMSIHKPYLIAESLGDTSGEILNMAESVSDGGGGFLETKLGVDLELLLSILISDEIKIKVDMLEVTNEFSAWAFYFDHFGVTLDAYPFKDVHRFGRDNGFCMFSGFVVVNETEVLLQLMCLL